MTNVNIDEFGENQRSFSNDSKYAVPIDIRLGENANLKTKVLTWRNCFSSSKFLWRGVKPTNEMLNQFLKLADATDEDILKYALRWGTLNLCRAHWLPSTHNPFCEQLESTPDPQGEPISQWRTIARLMQATLNIAKKLSDGQLAESKDWKIFIEEEFIRGNELLWAFDRNKKKYAEALKYQRRQIAGIIDGWIDISSLRPVFRWDGEQVSLTFIGSPKGKLFGALISQLLLIAGRSGLACCSECRSWYERKRRGPKKGQLNYCKDCKDRKVPDRNAKRAQREREKDRIKQKAAARSKGKNS